MSTITTRAGKGNPLTNNELDANFTNLNTDKLELGGTYSGGTANGVAYLNGSKVLTTGSALTFDGGNLIVGGTTLLSPLYSRRLEVQAGNSQTASLLSYTPSYSYWGMYNATDSNNYMFWKSGTNLLFGTVTNPDTTGWSEQMRLTSTGLGIGTSSLDGNYKVTISGNSAAVGPGIAFKDTVASPNNYNIGINGSKNFFITNAANPFQFQMDSSGNLGLGVTPSAWMGTSSSQYRAIQFPNGWTSLASDEGNGTVLLGSNFYAYGNQAYKYINSNYATMYQQNLPSGQHRWYTAPSGTAGNAISFTQAMTLDASGNLQLGTTGGTGFAGYTVFGLGAGASNGGIIQFQGQGQADGAHIRLDRSGSTLNNLTVETRSAFPLVLGTNGIERMRIDSSGNLLVGTTSQIGSGYKISVAPISSSGGGIAFRNFDTAGGVPYVFFNSSNSVVGSISSSNTATAYNTSSDYRLKENIQPMQNALAVVQQLNPVTYTWKADGSDGQGFIAHELQAIVPDCVTGEKDAVDAEGNPVYQGIDTSFLVATLTAAIKELKAELDATKAEVAALKAKLA